MAKPSSFKRGRSAVYLLLFVLGVATFAARVKTADSKSRLREVHEQSRQLEVTLEHKGKEVAGKELRVDAALRALNESERPVAS